MTECKGALFSGPAGAIPKEYGSLVSPVVPTVSNGVAKGVLPMTEEELRRLASFNPACQAQEAMRRRVALNESVDPVVKAIQGVYR